MIEGKEGMIKKKDFLILFGALVIVGLGIYVYAALIAITGTPIAFGNYSTTLFLNITAEGNGAASNMSNVTCWYNITGSAEPGAATYLTQILNTTGGQVGFNVSLDVSSFISSHEYNLTCTVYNLTDLNWTLHTQNITIDSTPPAVNFSGTTVIKGGNYTAAALGIAEINVTFVDDLWNNISIDGCAVFMNVSNSSGGWAPTNNWTQLAFLNSVTFNNTINFSAYPDGKYNITLIANDSNFTTSGLTGATTPNINNSEWIQIAIDSTAPAITLTKTSSTKSSITLTISAVDATTGVRGSCSVNREDALLDGVTITEGGLACGQSYTYIVACGDYVGNSGTATGSFSTDNCGGSTSGGSSGGTTTPASTSVSTVTATPTSPATISSFASGSGVKEIQLEVSETANNVQVTVKDYETNRPSEVSASVSGAYKYMNIETQNLANKLSKATMKIQVEKSWVSTKGIAKEDVVLFKYDEANDKWNELSTTYSNEDNMYYYYTVELTSFSYFAIASKGAVISGGEEGGETSTGGAEEGTGLLGLPYWAWILIILVVLVVIIGGGTALKRKK